LSAAEGETEQKSLFEAHAFSALERAKGHAYAFTGAMEEAAAQLEAGGHVVARDVRKGLELFRLVSARVDGLHRRLGEGAP
jgi:hypothetical protein